MGKGQQDVFSRYVRLTFNVGTVGDLTDKQLLERFFGPGGEWPNWPSRPWSIVMDRW